MAETTSISWTDSSFSPWIGCTKVSPGCANCYAENITRARVLRSQGHETWGKGAQRSRTCPDTWRYPVRWNAHAKDGFRRKVFPSLCDWLDDEVPIEWLADFLKLIHETPNLNWLLLTKRPAAWEPRMFDALGCVIDTNEAGPFSFKLEEWIGQWYDGTPPHNVWIGVSVEDQKRADERIPELLKIPAKVRFLSVEPMLGPIRLDWLGPDGAATAGINALTGEQRGSHEHPDRSTWGEHVDFVIYGGESGHKARPCNIEWIRDGVRQCRAAGVAPFVKQLGLFSIEERGSQRTRLLWEDTKGGDISEWPEDLRVREFPQIT